ncbi:hypothetical protein ANN_12798 [Periplaneta americana]|uniref:Uncharacterized protein n=1 Tax=Periplaneta americana TaxID=6978 RepID=A0ABQ8TIZ5_PERAM|nr:hypothetical protein ANN_12798 [Periplaneta americana]
MQETVISMLSHVCTCASPACYVPSFAVSLFITFESVRGADVFSGQLNATQNGAQDKTMRVHCLVLCEAQFMEKRIKTVTIRKEFEHQKTLLKESLEQNQTKSQCCLSVQVGIKRTLCRNIIKKYLHPYPYKFTVVHALKHPDEPSHIEFCRWFLSEVESGLLDPQFFISSDEAQFSLSGYVNSENIRHYVSVNLHGVLGRALA